MFLNTCPESDRRDIVEMIESIGGWLDGGVDGHAGCLLILTIPASVGFEKIESVMAIVSSRFSMEKWMYGNVYDVRDGSTPLNWWVE
jgi:hypothetical protein